MGWKQSAPRHRREDCLQEISMEERMMLQEGTMVSNRKADQKMKDKLHVRTSALAFDATAV
jgi:hypothetical protein